MNTIVSSRSFAWSPTQLFVALSDPKRLALWWGPNGFTNTIHSFDLQPGGLWELTMHAPDGSDHPSTKKFVEIRPAERLVYQQLGEAHRFQMKMDLASDGNGTRLTWTMTFEDPEDLTNYGEIIRNANEENFDRLEAHLGSSALSPPQNSQG